MLLPPPSPARSALPRPDAQAIGSTVGEAFAIAPDTYVVPGWWSFPAAGLGMALATLVVRGQATAVVDTAPAPLEDDWLGAVLALVDPAEIRWIVATSPDPVRAGCVAALHALAPRATVVVPGSGCTTLDLGRGQVVDLHEHQPGDRGAEPAAAGPVTVPGQLVVEARPRGLLWTDIVGGALTRPAVDVVAVDDDDLVAALSRRPRALRPGEVDRTAALGLRVLGSPIGPVARGAGVARALDLAGRAEALRSPSGRALGALLAPLGPAPWTTPAPI